MGRVKVDLEKSMHKHDAVHPYNEIGVRQLLRDIHRLHNAETYGGDYAATILRCDMERALQSNALTPRQRQVVALYYYAQLTQQECARVLGVARQGVQQHIDNAIYHLSAYMCGVDMELTQNTDDAKVERNGIATPYLDEWLRDVADNVYKWWLVYDEELSDINLLLGMPKRKEHTHKSKRRYYSSNWRRPEWEVLMREPYNKPTQSTRNQRKFGEHNNDDEDMSDTDYAHRKFAVRLPNDKHIEKTGRYWTYSCK